MCVSFIEKMSLCTRDGLWGASWCEESCEEYYALTEREHLRSQNAALQQENETLRLEIANVLTKEWSTQQEHVNMEEDMEFLLAQNKQLQTNLQEIMQEHLAPDEIECEYCHAIRPFTAPFLLLPSAASSPWRAWRQTRGR